MKRLVTGLLASAFAMAMCSADEGPYAEEKRIWSESEDRLVFHYHDWRDGDALNLLYADLRKHDRFFGEENKHAYVEVWDKKSNTVLWRKPSTAFTHIWISPDAEYIVGISDVKYRNPYQLVVFGRDGEVVLKRAIRSKVARMTPEELRQFFDTFPEAEPFLKSRIRRIGGATYIDYHIIGMPKALPEGAWKSLSQKAVRDPEVLWVQESVTNSVYWFDKRKPDFAIIRTGGKILLELNNLIRWEYEPEEPRSGKLYIELPG